MRIRYSARSLLFAVVAVALVTALLSATWRATSNRVVIENRSGLAIISLSVTVAGRSIGFPPVPPGDAVEASYQVIGDDHFILAGKLSDGTEFGGDFGYVTSGMYGNVGRFVIEPGGVINFDQSF